MNTPLGVEIDAVTHRFRGTEALTDVSLTIRPGTITGLVGRNGAGKTTLLSLVAGLRPAQTGSVRVGGREVWEDPSVTSRVCLVRERGGVLEDQRIRHTLRIQAALRPHWDQGYAERLLDRFEVPLRKTPEHLSRGQRSILGAVIGLASRAEVTLLDEVYLGMDAVARRTFYDELMADYLAHPRTIVLSSHLLDEVEDLFEDVVVLDRGRVVAAGDADEVRQQHSTAGRLASLTDVLVDVSTGRTPS
ncbi:ABC transporter ATP-binding protein [Ornithinimicrobium humiphilum]|uniref:ABC-2 type transport system ATP-binding protein n=1 Tax=Ornithinimicrobium humiphilum TaxID=125288 RepID=A0A543KLH3_9MICO|nr:ABC transporter ATP-binding protein [Ornithinimicrobium humiphilum]TQM95933.1 ABC-2 type transport system ATP-binding protein [Ornithinimicrobium humiphilum]